MADLASLRSRYDALVSSGTIEADPAQVALVERLDALGTALAERGRGRAPSRFGWLLGQKASPPPTGLYVWGSVGRGKTMLMDLFFEGLPVEAKRRAHFHVFMADAHRRIHDWRQALKAGKVSGDDPIRPVAAAIAEEAQVLCFDEFRVSDIADAMILGRLFTALFAEGVVVVATSNVPPEELYRNGLNRALFLPFIRLLQERVEVVRLDSRTDFRLEKIGDEPVYFAPADAEASRRMDALFTRLTGGAPARPATLTVLGHPVEVPRQAMGTARFGFEELCGRPYGASDFIALAERFHTVFLDGIPRMGTSARNEARRFITAVDVFYERHLRLIASAEARPDDLYDGDDGPERFEFARTASRLHEMGSTEYLASAPDPAPTGSAAGLVET